MMGVWLRARTIFAKEATARPRQAGPVSSVLPGAWASHTAKRIPIMVWGQTQWKQPILGQLTAGLSPLDADDHLVSGVGAAPHDPRERAEHYLPNEMANPTPAVAPDLLETSGHITKAA